MKVGLLSSTLFGMHCLEEALGHVSGIEIGGILTTPSKIFYTHTQKLISISRYADYKTWAMKRSIPISYIQETPSASNYIDFARDNEIDCFLALGWYFIIPEQVLNSVLCLGIHASLLPRYRGGAPLVWAIINGEQEAGVSLFQLTEKMDAGVLYGQRRFSISRSEDIADVYGKAEDASVDLIKAVLPEILNGNNCGTHQDESMSSYYPMRTPKDGLIDWSMSSESVYNFIRAQTYPYPGAYTEYEGKRRIIWKAVPCDVSVNGGPPGTWFEDNTLNTCVVCGDGSALRILNWSLDDGS